MGTHGPVGITDFVCISWFPLILLELFFLFVELSRVFQKDVCIGIYMLPFLKPLAHEPYRIFRHHYQGVNDQGFQDEV